MDIEEKVIRFIKAKSGVEVTNDSVLFDDLGMDGIDAKTFFEEFSEVFDMDTSGFNHSDYHFSEYELCNIFLTIYRSIFKRNKLRKKTFTVQQLIKAAEQKQWSFLKMPKKCKKENE